MSWSAFGAIIFSWYGLLSLVAFGAFAWDKRAARLDRRRIRERTLHTLTLMGGFVGSLLAMRLLRHKTLKRGFGLMPWAALVLHVCLWVMIDRLFRGP